jgi:hypothetical protein
MEPTVRALPKTPPHNVADWSESVKASSFTATLRGGGACNALWTLTCRQPTQTGLDQAIWLLCCKTRT